MKIELEQVSPHEIEKRSFEIITEELNGRTFPEDQELVVKRCIHTSADFDYADNLCFSEHAVAKGIEAIREGACIVTDTQMARSGINKKVLARHGGEALCFMSDEDVAARAKETGSTRAAACMEKAAELDKKLIIAVGNAPTALVRLYELIGEGKIKPALIIGVPVGFVNVVQSKELIRISWTVHRKELCTVRMCTAFSTKKKLPSGSWKHLQRIRELPWSRFTVSITRHSKGHSMIFLQMRCASIST